MLRQSLSAASRALRSAPRLLGAPEPLLRQTQLRTAPSAFLLSAAKPTTIRWYSDAKETPAEEAAAKEAPAKEAAAKEAPAEGESEKADAKEEAGETDPLTELKKALEAKDNEVRDWKDKCLRSVADFRNLQERTKREVKTARDFAITKFAKDLVDSVDNLDRALTTVPAEKLAAAEKTEDLKDLNNLYEGLKMTESVLMQTLAKHGLERLNPEGDKFDPNEHEATFMAPQPDKENNTVFHVQQKGFKLNGRVLRAAKVGVVKNA